MTSARYDEAMETGKLTAGEVSQGWHWCPEFDDLLLGPGTHEMEGGVCICGARVSPPRYWLLLPVRLFRKVWPRRYEGGF